MGSLNETNPSLWAATASDGPAYPTLTEGTIGGEVDVAVIGAGIAGLSTALSALEAGATVCVLEADRVCSGVTAYTTAKVTALHGLIYAGLADSHGDDKARAYGAANQDAIRQIETWIDRHGIECDFSRRPAFTYTTATDKVEAVALEVEVAQRFGLPATFTTSTDLPYEVRGAIRFEDQAQFHPRDYALGVAEAINALGGRIFERTRIADVDEGKPCTLRTEAGIELRASQVVVATQLPFVDRGGFFAKCHPTRSYAMAVSLTGDARCPTGMYLGADQPTRSVRSALGDTVVVLGGEGHKTGQDGDTRGRYAALERWAREHFAVDTIKHRWSAQDYASVDGLPFVGRQTPGSRVFVATGFKKWGMTNGTAAGLLLAAELTGRENPWRIAFDATRQRSTLTSRDLFRENANVAKQFVGDRLATNVAPSAAELQPGEGAIVRLDGDKVAAYRDEAGSLHAISPVCTHLGCLVAFNTAERSWDCPCHGSRYTVDGEVLQGPATEPLEAKVIEREGKPVH